MKAEEFEEQYGFTKEETSNAVKPFNLIKLQRFWSKKMCRSCKDKAWNLVVRERKPFSTDMLCESCKAKAEALK